MTLARKKSGPAGASAEPVPTAQPVRSSSIIGELERKRDRAREGGGAARVEAQHTKGKLTARERLEVLLDPDSFEEYDMFVEHRAQDLGIGEQKVPGDGVV